jgi:RHS repeat-associated protein
MEQLTILGTSTYKTYFTHPDHLGSTHLVTSASGNPISRYTYFPYGSTRTTLGTTTYNQPNQFLGEDRDPEADLSYLNHRYYNSNQGQFRSQDPVFWSTNLNLQNPQSLNSYSYAEGNPITLKDPDGLAAKDAATQAEINRLKREVLGLMKQQLQQMVDDFNKGGRTGMSNPREGSRTARNSSRSRSERAGAAYGTAVSSGAIVAATIYAPVLTVGATLGIAQRQADDKRNNKKSTPRQYAGSALFGAGAAYATQQQSLVQTILRTGVISGIGNIFLDGSTQPANIATDVAASVAGKYTGNMVSTPQVSAALGGIAEYATYKTISDYLAN